MEISRRLGSSPRERSGTEVSCPDIFELSDGRFAIIGTDLTEDIEPRLPPDAIRAPYERIIVISRETLLHAKFDIPEA